MRGPDQGDRIVVLEAEATDDAIFLTIKDLNARVKRAVELKLDGHVPQVNLLLASLIDASVRQAVEETVDGRSLQFESEAAVITMIDQVVVRVANLLRKGMNQFADLAVTGYEAADVLHDPGDTRYAKVTNGALTKFAIRAHNTSNFELEIKLREVLRRRKDPKPKERILNLYHLQDSYHNLGNREQCIAVNKELIEYIRELSGVGVDEATLKLGDSLEFIEFRSHDIVFNLRRDLAEDCEEEAISYYDNTSKRSKHFEVLNIALRRLRIVFDARGDTATALSYALRLSKTQHEADKPAEVRKTERHVDRYLRNLGINFSTLGRDHDNDLAKLSILDASSLNTLAERVKNESRFTAEGALLEVLLTKALNVAERIRTFHELDKSYSLTANAQKKLELSDRYLVFLDGITADALEPGQNIQRLKFRAKDGRYKTQIKSKDHLGEAAEFDPEEMKIFYEDYLVSEEADCEDKIICFEALGKIHGTACDHAKAWDCAVQILELEPSYTVKVLANDAEERNGDRLANDQRLAARGSVVKAIRERKERLMRERMEAEAREEQAGIVEQRRLQELEAREVSLRAKRELLTFLESLKEESLKWRKAGIFRDMYLIPDDKKAQLLQRFDALVTTINDPTIVKFTQFVRQNLNATSPFIKPTILDKAIEQLRRII